MTATDPKIGKEIRARILQVLLDAHDGMTCTGVTQQLIAEMCPYLDKSLRIATSKVATHLVLLRRHGLVVSTLRNGGSWWQITRLGASAASASALPPPPPSAAPAHLPPPPLPKLTAPEPSHAYTAIRRIAEILGVIIPGDPDAMGSDLAMAVVGNAVRTLHDQHALLLEHCRYALLTPKYASDKSLAFTNEQAHGLLVRLFYAVERANEVFDVLGVPGAGDDHLPAFTRGVLAAGMLAEARRTRDLDTGDLLRRALQAGSEDEDDHAWTIHMRTRIAKPETPDGGKE
jgi:hypothetical protein